MKILTIFKIILIFLVFASGSYYAYKKVGNSLSGRRQQKTRIYVVARKDLIQRVTISGNVIPKRKTIVSAPFDGYVKKLFVKMGQVVEKDSPIVSVVQSLQSIDPVYPLRAPYRGVVVFINRYEGEYVSKGSSRSSEDFILRIDDLEDMYITSNVPEIDMAKIKKDQQAIIKITALSNKQYKGQIEQMSLASKEQANMWHGNSDVVYPIKIRILNHDKKIKPGMSAIMDIITHKKEKVLVLPHEFILEKKDGHYVYLKSGGERKIKIGMQNEDYFEILEGLKEGEEVKQINFMEILSREMV